MNILEMAMAAKMGGGGSGGGGSGGGASSWDDLGYNADGTINHINPDFIEYMYGKKSVIADIIPEAELVLSDGMYEFSEEFPLTAGETYIVGYNGTTYECVCTDLAGQMLVLGSAPAFGVTGTEPFGFLVAVGQGMSALMDVNGATEAVFSLSGMITEITKVPNEFIDTTPFFDLSELGLPTTEVGNTVEFSEEYTGGDLTALKMYPVYLALQKGPVRLRWKTIRNTMELNISAVCNGVYSENQGHIYASSVDYISASGSCMTYFDFTPIGVTATVKQLTL